jgi:hypothetical protein
MDIREEIIVDIINNNADVKSQHHPPRIKARKSLTLAIQPAYKRGIFQYSNTV